MWTFFLRQNRISPTRNQRNTQSRNTQYPVRNTQYTKILERPKVSFGWHFWHQKRYHKTLLVLTKKYFGQVPCELRETLRKKSIECWIWLSGYWTIWCEFSIPSQTKKVCWVLGIGYAVILQYQLMQFISSQAQKVYWVLDLGIGYWTIYRNFLIPSQSKTQKVTIFFQYTIPSTQYPKFEDRAGIKPFDS